MCRGHNICSLLGTDPEKWSRDAPLPLPEWAPDSLDAFAEAVALAAKGDREASRSALLRTRDAELSEFYIEHAQNAGRARLKIQGVTWQRVPAVKGRYSARVEREVFARDSYTCRYCETPVVPQVLFKAYAQLVGHDAFRTGKTNACRHGTLLVFRACADHVVPRNLGGSDDLSNLVTSCRPCNFGKSRYTLEALRLDDPRDSRPQPRLGWSGLTELLPALRAQARSR